MESWVGYSTGRIIHYWNDNKSYFEKELLYVWLYLYECWIEGFYFDGVDHGYCYHIGNFNIWENHRSNRFLILISFCKHHIAHFEIMKVILSILVNALGTILKLAVLDLYFKVTAQSLMRVSSNVALQFMKILFWK